MAAPSELPDIALSSPTPHPDAHAPSPSSSSSTASSDSEQGQQSRTALPNDHPPTEPEDDADDDAARAASPRRSSEDVERPSRATRRALQAYVFDHPLPFSPSR